MVPFSFVVSFSLRLEQAYSNLFTLFYGVVFQKYLLLCVFLLLITFFLLHYPLPPYLVSIIFCGCAQVRLFCLAMKNLIFTSNNSIASYGHSTSLMMLDMNNCIFSTILFFVHCSFCCYRLATCCLLLVPLFLTAFFCAKRSVSFA